MATKLSKNDTKQLLNEGFFDNWEVIHSFNKQEIHKKLNDPKELLDSKDERVKVKIKFNESLHLKTECIGHVIDVDEKGFLRVIEDGANCPIIYTIDPKLVIGVFFTTLGREIEITFGVGKYSVSFLLDE